MRSEWPELFEAIGTNYGAADEEHFSLPNAVGRCIIGAGTGYELGSIGGEAEHVLTVNELPVHNHSAIFKGTSESHSHIVDLTTKEAGEHIHRYDLFVRNNGTSQAGSFDDEHGIAAWHRSTATNPSGEHKHQVKGTSGSIDYS